MTTSNIREGVADVPGARLRYRLAGTPGAPLLVFENGWGASYEMWTWVERELAPHAQLLFYDRAGVGGSELLAPQSVAGLSAQFAALPGALGFSQPVIAVGQSYGGLMCSLHAAQRRDVLRAVVEIDPTPEQAHPKLDGTLRKLPSVIRVLKAMLRLGLPDLLFAPAMKVLPSPERDTLLRVSLGNPASLDAALAELALLDGIRAAIAAGGLSGLPRLLIGAAATAPVKGAVMRLMASRRTAQEVVATNLMLQQQRAAHDPDCRYLTLPYDHGALVFEQGGARASAAEVLAFVRAQRA